MSKFTLSLQQRPLMVAPQTAVTNAYVGYSDYPDNTGISLILYFNWTDEYSNVCIQPGFHRELVEFLELHGVTATAHRHLMFAHVETDAVVFNISHQLLRELHAVWPESVASSLLASN